MNGGFNKITADKVVCTIVKLKKYSKFYIPMKSTCPKPLCLPVSRSSARRTKINAGMGN